MRRLLFALLLCGTLGAAPSRTQTYVEGQVIEPEDVTENEDNIFAYLQAGVDTYRANSITTTALQDAAVTTAKIATEAVTATSIANSTITATDIANGDHGDFTYTSNSAAIDANAVALSTDTTGNYVATVADSGSSTVTVSGSGSEGAAVTLLVTDVSCTNCLGMTELAATLTAADGDLIDLDAINVSSATEGLLLPQATSCASGTAEGQLCWDTNDDALYAGSGTAANVIGGSWIFVETMAMSGTSVTSSALPTTSDVFLLVWDEVVSASSSVTMTMTMDNSTNYDYQDYAGTITTAASSIVLDSSTTGNQAFSGTMVLNRVSDSANDTIVQISLASSAALATTDLVRARRNGSGQMTTVTLAHGGVGFSAGSVHIFRLSKQ